MYRVDRKKNSMEPVTERKFSEIGIKERDHLQEWIADYPEALGEDLLIIQKEFDGFDDTRERLDLLALDKQGRLVIIENKLDDTGRNVVWQALKYASYCSTLSKNQVISIFQKYLDRYSSGERAEQKITEFFDDTDLDEISINIGNEQRIIFIAANFRKEVTSTALWLLNHNISVKCIKATPYTEGEDLFLNLDQIIPIPDAEEYTISMGKKADEERGERGELPNRQRVRKKYWEQFIPALRQSSINLFPTIVPQVRSYQSHSYTPGVRLAIDFKRSELQCRLVFKGQNGLGVLSKIDINELKSVFPDGVELVENGSRFTKYVVRIPLNAYDESNWGKANEWFIDTIKEVTDSIKPMSWSNNPGHIFR